MPKSDRIHFIALPVVLFLAFGATFLLPSRGQSAASAVEFPDSGMQLPLLVDEWQGVEGSESQKERDLLSADTKFEKADYTRFRPDSFSFEKDRVHASIVLSGSDLNNSIHRPERCLPSQGHQITGSSGLRLELSNGQVIPMRRLTTRIPRKFEDHPDVLSKTLVYYFFVGHDHITNSHLERTLVDMKDRLVFGRDQRWAYIQLTSTFETPELGHDISIEDADAAMQDLLRDLVPDIINWDAVKSIDSGN